MHDRFAYFLRASARKRCRPRDDYDERGADGPRVEHVGRILPSLDEFRSRVGQRADHYFSLARRQRGGEIGGTEVDKLDFLHVYIREDKVFGLNVSVSDIVLVQVANGKEQLSKNRCESLRRQLILMEPQSFVQRRAFEKFHDDKRRVLGVKRFVGTYNMLVSQMLRAVQHAFVGNKCDRNGTQLFLWNALDGDEFVERQRIRPRAGSIRRALRGRLNSAALQNSRLGFPANGILGACRLPVTKSRRRFSRDPFACLSVLVPVGAIKRPNVHLLLHKARLGDATSRLITHGWASLQLRNKLSHCGSRGSRRRLPAMAWLTLPELSFLRDDIRKTRSLKLHLLLLKSRPGIIP
mmetsp:Transcript_259/g.626  ORF Transcript_259/g.626 Transcript_259/m.626 type:complete len:352 (-) Transcript_259:104-1159(-)